MKCPRCKREVAWPGLVLDSIPQQTVIDCPNCGKIRLYSSSDRGGWIECYQEASDAWFSKMQ